MTYNDTGNILITMTWNRASSTDKWVIQLYMKTIHKQLCISKALN